MSYKQDASGIYKSHRRLRFSKKPNKKSRRYNNIDRYSKRLVEFKDAEMDIEREMEFKDLEKRLAPKVLSKLFK